jgi:fructokinase
VRLANDADCFALSEAHDGAAAGAGLVFGVILGTGVGGGLVFGGSLHTGPNGLAGEWGHVPLPYFRQRAAPGMAPESAPAEPLFQLESALGDRACYCGRLNCIETFLSGPGLSATHRELWAEERTAEALAADGGDAARLTLALHARQLARSLAQIVNVLDPDAIVLGGGLSKLPGLADILTAVAPEFLFRAGGAGAAPVLRIGTARWGDDSGVRGAARLWPPAGVEAGGH